jgi:arylsulfatase A-like enzyme
MKSSSRTTWWCWLFALLLFGGVAGAKSPNVVMISVDDLNDWIAPLGGYKGTIHTPNFDRLASKGTLFLNAHCPSPVCNPSRTSILLGLRPSTTGIYGNSQWWRPTFPHAVSMPSHFKNNGYITLGAGKVHHHNSGHNPPDQWDAYRRQTYDELWKKQNVMEATLRPPEERTPPPSEFPLNGLTEAALGNRRPVYPPSFDWGGLNKTDEELGDGQVTRWAIDALGKSYEKPLFLAVGIFKPHVPWYAPKKYFDMYPLESIVLPEVKADDLDDVPEAGRKLNASWRRDFDLVVETGKYREAVRAYVATITYVDALLGELLDAIEARPDADNTIILLWSDHGWHLGEKGQWHKFTLWERATRVPLIVSVPGLTKPGSRCAEPVNLIDLYPTLNELCGLPPRAELEGRSIAAQLKDPAARRDEPSLTTFLRGNHAIRDRDWRYIRYADGSEELYDHRVDPNEWTNVAGQPAHAAVKRELARWLPKVEAADAPDRGAYDFDLASYSWTPKANAATKPAATPGSIQRSFTGGSQ